MLESLFNKVGGLEAYNFIRKRLQHRYFPVNIATFFRTDILKNIETTPFKSTGYEKLITTSL